MHSFCKHCCFSLALFLAAQICGAETYTEHGKPSPVPAESKMTAAPQADEGRAPHDVQGETRVSRDDSIARALKNELRHDPLISPHRVDVQASAGTAVLTGTVTDLMTKERATHIAEAVKGVSAVRNDIVVVPVKRVSTDNLEAAIRTSLVSNPATDAFQVQIKATPDGKVVLTGDVGSWAERELAGRMAKSVSGVTAVRNDIQVQRRASRTDIDIEQEVERLMKWDAYIEEGDIDVAVRDGVVSLSGQVASAAEKRRAIGLAYTAGTESVRADQLEVNPGASSKASQSAPSALSDAELSQAVRAMLNRDPEADAGAVDVTVAGGVVILEGEVENAKAERVALRRAAMVSGVKEVRDALTVNSREAHSEDREIAREIVAALAANPITEAYKISVAADEGVVTLSGHVDSWFERGTADDIASGIAGVHSVENDLIVERAEDRLAYDPYVDTWSIYEYDWYTPKPPTTWKQDSEIVRSIEQEFTWSPFVDGDQIDVSVHKGVATLEGEVGSIAQIEAATENALEGGAAGVVNKLRIRG